MEHMQIIAFNNMMEKGIVDFSFRFKAQDNDISLPRRNSEEYKVV